VTTVPAVVNRRLRRAGPPRRPGLVNGTGARTWHLPVTIEPTSEVTMRDIHEKQDTPFTVSGDWWIGGS